MDKTDIIESNEEVVEETVEVESTEEKVAPKRNFRQPSSRASRNFGWESLDTVQDDRKNE